MNCEGNNHAKINHKDGIITDWNKEFKDIFSIHDSEIKGKQVSAFLSEQTFKDLEDTLDENIKIGTSTTEIHKNPSDCLNCKETSKTFLIVSYEMESSIFNTKFIDVDYIKSLDALNSDVNKNTPIGITISEAGSEDNALIYANSGFEDITGYSEEEVLGRDCRFLQGEKTRMGPVRKMSEAIHNSKPVSVELRNYKKSGDIFWNNVTIVPVKDDNNKVEYFIGYQQDITERKKQEIQRDIFQKQADTSTDMIAILDDELNIFYVNDTICERMGYDKDLLIDHSVEKIYSEEFTENMAQYIRKSESNSPTKSILTGSDGGYIYVEQDISRYSGADISSDYYYVISIKELTQDMINNQVINVLNRVLRHNLRTDITVIQSYADTIKSKNHENDKEIESILKRTENMKDVSDKMKRVRNLITGTVETNPISVEELREIILNYSSECNINVNLNGADMKSSYIKPGGIISIISKDIICMIADSTEDAINICVNFDEVDKRMKITYQSKTKFVNLNDWDIVCSGVEDPLNHTIGVDLWVMRWAVISVGGSIEIKDCTNGQLIEITVPKI
jgi:PAS domain S-box-containing protein